MSYGSSVLLTTGRRKIGLNTFHASDQSQKSLITNAVLCWVMAAHTSSPYCAGERDSCIQCLGKCWCLDDLGGQA